MRNRERTIDDKVSKSFPRSSNVEKILGMRSRYTYKRKEVRRDMEWMRKTEMEYHRDHKEDIKSCIGKREDKVREREWQ